jgi:hypothetical protein
MLDLEGFVTFDRRVNIRGIGIVVYCSGQDICWRGLPFNAGF